MIAMPNSAAVMLPLDPTDAVLQRFARLEQQRLWPNGPRHLGVDALGVLVMVGLARTLGDPAWIDRAEALVGEVDRVLRRRRGYRAGEGALRDEQVFHELAVWVFALAVLGEERPGYRARAVEVVREVHRAFVAPGQGVHARRGEDVDHASPDTGFGALDPIRGWVVYRVIDEVGLAEEIAEMEHRRWAAELEEMTRRQHIFFDIWATWGIQLAVTSPNDIIDMHRIAADWVGIKGQVLVNVN